MLEMYIPEEKLQELHNQINLYPGFPVGDESLASEVYRVARLEDEAARLSMAVRLYYSLLRLNGVGDNGLGPPYTLSCQFETLINLVILPGIQAGHRLYVFRYEINQPLSLAEIWLSHARCFSPVAPDETNSLKIPVSDILRYRAEVLKAMVHRRAPRSFFFPESVA